MSGRRREVGLQHGGCGTVVTTVTVWPGAGRVGGGSVPLPRGRQELSRDGAREPGRRQHLSAPGMVAAAFRF